MRQKFDEDQEEIRPLVDKVRQALIEGGVSEFDYHVENPGFTVSGVTPPTGRHYVQIQHVDFPENDRRPALAQYAAALEKASIDHQIKGPIPLERYGEWYWIEVDFREIPQEEYDVPKLQDY